MTWSILTNTSSTIDQVTLTLGTMRLITNVPSLIFNEKPCQATEETNIDDHTRNTHKAPNGNAFQLLARHWRLIDRMQVFAAALAQNVDRARSISSKKRSRTMYSCHCLGSRSAQHGQKREQTAATSRRDEDFSKHVLGKRECVNGAKSWRTRNWLKCGEQCKTTAKRNDTVRGSYVASIYVQQILLVHLKTAYFTQLIP